MRCINLHCQKVFGLKLFPEKIQTPYDDHRCSLQGCQRLLGQPSPGLTVMKNRNAGEEEQQEVALRRHLVHLAGVSEVFLFLFFFFISAKLSDE